MFIPTTPEEVDRLGWDPLDVVLVSGDTYTDNSYNGTAVIGHWLIDRGYRVGIIAQPDVSSGEDISRLGRPELFWSVSAGCVDSMVANYTPTRKFRKEDDFTPGGVNDRRPDRACIAYTNLIKRHCKGRPVVLGGIEASLRRIAHYDFWSDSVRRSILFDSKADAIAYGMAELATLELAERMRAGEDWRGVRGVCWISGDRPEGCLEMPSYEEVSRRDDRRAFMEAYSIFRRNCDPVTARPLCQAHGPRWLVQNRPQRALTQAELDSVHESSYENAVHPYYAKMGPVKAMETVRNSITTHRGCYGDCSFCAIAAHQGTTVVSRSKESIMREARRIASSPGFNGVIQDVGGPTANMYGIECARKRAKGRCEDRRCLGSKPCPMLPIDHTAQVDLLDSISEVEGVRKVFVSSGVRHDMVVADRRGGQAYLDCLVGSHVSGQMKLAPEHVCDDVLKLMGKPGRSALVEFKERFDESCERQGRDEYLTYYFIAAHPGCTDAHMRELADFCRGTLGISPEQVQVFTPTPSTYSTAMWWCGFDEAGHPIRTERSIQGRQRQKDAVVARSRGGRRAVGAHRREVRPAGRLRGGALRRQEGLLLRVGAPGEVGHGADLRLPAGGPGRGPRRLRRDGRQARAGAGLGGPGVVHGLRAHGRVRGDQEARVHQEEQEPAAHGRRGVQVDPGLRGEADGRGAGAPVRRRQLVVLLDAQVQPQPPRLLRHHVPRGGHIVDPRLAHGARPGRRLRGLPRVPAPPPGLPPRRPRPRRGDEGLGARVPRLEGVRGRAQAPGDDVPTRRQVYLPSGR